MNVFNSKHSLSEAFFSQTIPSYQPDVDVHVVVSHFCDMLITLASKRSANLTS